MKHFTIFLLLLFLSPLTLSSHPQNYLLQAQKIAFSEDPSQDDLNRALKLVNAQLKETPGAGKVLFLRAFIYQRLDENERALKDLKEGIGTGWAGVYMMYELRSGIYEEMGEWSKGVKDCDMALQTMEDSDDDSNFIQKILVRKANCLCRLKDFRGAEVVLDECAKMDKDGRELWVCEKFMTLYSEVGRYHDAIDNALLYAFSSDRPDMDGVMNVLKADVEYSMSQLKEYMDLNKNSTKFYTIMAFAEDFCEEIGRYDMALEFLNSLGEAVGAGDDPDFCQQRAIVYQQLGDYPSAIEDYTYAINADTGNLFYAYCQRGDCYRECAEYEKAIADFTAAAAVDSSRAYPFYGTGWCYELMGDDARAVECYSRAIAAEPQYAYSYFMRGAQYLKRGDRRAASADFKKVLSLDTIPQPGSSRQYALHHLGDDASALDWMDRIILSSPYNAGCFYDKACLLCLMNRPQEALKALRSALEKGYRSFRHIDNDDDLDLIREMPEFRELIKKYRNKAGETQKGDVVKI